MEETKTYTVTKYAGPKVAGRVAKAGETLELTETQARAELVAGAIVNGKKSDDGFVKDPLARKDPDKAPDSPPADPPGDKGKGKEPNDSPAGKSKPGVSPSATG